MYWLLVVGECSTLVTWCTLPYTSINVEKGEDSNSGTNK